MSRGSRQFWALAILVLLAGCAAERAQVRRMVTRRPSLPSFNHSPQRNYAPSPATQPDPSEHYMPTPEEDIPPPPSGASLEEGAGLQKLKRPPLLRPVALHVGQEEELVSLEVPAVR